MTKLQFGVISAMVVASLAIFLWMQHRWVIKLHEENESLRQQVEQLAQAAAENERQSNLLAEATTFEAPDRLRELLRLRSEVAGLKSQLADVLKKESGKEAAKQQSPGFGPIQQQMEQKEMALAKMGYMQKWMLAFLQYANQHQGQFPSNFDLAASLLPEEAASQTNLGPDQFEIVYQGSVNDITNQQSAIVIREKEPWQAFDGGWVRGYSFADGHIEIHKSADGNFEPWEAQHLVRPQGAGQPIGEPTVEKSETPRLR